MDVKTYLISCSFMCTSVFVNASETNNQLIEEIRYNGDNQTVYFVGESNWVASDCSGARYAQVKLANTPGMKEIMSIGLSAKIAKINVKFSGECNSNTNYFDANYIILR